MLRRLVFPVILLVAFGAVAEPQLGIKPRKSPESYPAISAQPKVTFGAEVLSTKQVRRLFVSSLGKRYLVVELGAFPNSQVELSPQAFSLLIDGQKDVLHPADPRDIADVLANKEAVNHDVTISPVAGVTYSTGGDPYDPYGHGWSTTSGVMVDTGGQQRNPKTVAADRNTIVTELTDKQFPAGLTDKKSAGYLYFPVPHRVEKGTKLQLQFEAEGEKILIPLNTPAQ